MASQLEREESFTRRCPLGERKKERAPPHTDDPPTHPSRTTPSNFNSTPLSVADERKEGCVVPRMSKRVAEEKERVWGKVLETVREVGVEEKEKERRGASVREM
jgi:hypothetical protein